MNTEHLTDQASSAWLALPLKPRAQLWIFLTLSALLAVEDDMRMRRPRNAESSSGSSSSTVVATTRHSRTNDLTTSKALSRLSSNKWGIIRELDKEPSLYCSSFYITYKWSMLQQCVYLMSIHHASTSCPITHPHVFSLRPPCFLHVP